MLKTFSTYMCIENSEKFAYVVTLDKGEGHTNSFVIADDFTFFKYTKQYGHHGHEIFN